MTRTRKALDVLVLMTLGLALGGVFSPAHAQCEIEAEMDRALFLIDRAAEVVEKSDLAEARELVHAARTRVKEAADKAQRGERVLACRLLVVAQNLAKKAVEIAEAGLRGLEQLERMLQRTDELLLETAAGVRGSGVPEAVKLLQVAGEQQREAWTAFRGRRPRVALKLTTLARNTAQRAARLAEGNTDLSLANLERELRQTDRLLDEAVRALGDAARDSEALKAARRLQNQAKLRFQSDRPRLALRLTHQARTMIRRALRQSDAQVDAADVEAMIRDTALLIADLNRAAEDAGSDRAKKLLTRATNLLQDARKALGEHDPRSAFGSARAASALALDVAEMLERGEEE